MIYQAQWVGAYPQEYDVLYNELSASNEGLRLCAQLAAAAGLDESLDVIRSECMSIVGSSGMEWLRVREAEWWIEGDTNERRSW